MSFDKLNTINLTLQGKVSIPLEQGNVFRLRQTQNKGGRKSFQSLWNRAMSFDVEFFRVIIKDDTFQSLWNRAMSFDCSGVFKPCVARLPRATSQLFLMPEELGIDLIKY